MSFNLQKTKVCALPDASGWVEAYDGVKFVLLISTQKDNSNVNDLVVVRNFFKKVHDEFMNSNLREAIKKVVEEFKFTLGDFQIAAIAQDENSVQTVALGGGEVFIYRGGALASILKSVDQNLISAKGIPKDQDVIILGTRNFFEAVDYITLKSAVEKGGPVGAVADIETKFSEENLKGPLGVYFVKFIDDDSTPIINQLPIEQLPIIKQTLNSPFSTLKSRLLSLIPERKIFVRNMEENPAEEQSKKTTMSIGVLILVILFVSIIFGLIQKNNNNQKAKYEGKLTEAQHLLDEAVGLTGVSGERARELFGQSETKLKEIQELKIKDQKIDDLANAIAQKRGEVLGEYNTDPSLYLDLTLLSANFKSDYTAISGGQMFLLDKNNKKLISIEIDNKKSKVVAGSDKIDKVDGLASYDGRPFILNDEEITEVGSTSRKVLEKDWEAVPLIYSFAGNMYLLAKDSNSIYRYSGQTDGTFGTRYDWLAKSVTTDFSNVKSWTMDGSIYVLTSTNKIVKFSRGSTQGFSIKGVYPELINIEAIYANEDNEYFYVLDKAGKRIVVLTKSGDYKAQYVGDKIGEANNLIVSEADKKILLLTGPKIFSIEIKHM